MSREFEAIATTKTCEISAFPDAEFVAGELIVLISRNALASGSRHRNPAKQPGVGRLTSCRLPDVPYGERSDVSRPITARCQVWHRRPNQQSRTWVKLFTLQHLQIHFNGNSQGGFPCSASDINADHLTVAVNKRPTAIAWGQLNIVLDHVRKSTAAFTYNS